MSKAAALSRRAGAVRQEEERVILFTYRRRHYVLAVALAV
jgi:hypothetical protein